MTPAFALAAAVAATTAFQADPTSAPSDQDSWPDAVVLKNDSVVRCRILAASPALLSIEYPRPSGPAAQSARRDLKWSDLKAADFSMDREFRRLASAENPARDTQRVAARWDALAPMVPLPNHPAGELALALARLALATSDAGAHRRALTACRVVATRDWNRPRRDQARWLIVQLLNALKQPDEALTEARALVDDAHADPETVMPALLFAARGDFQALQQLEEDNPRWIEDDLVRPERMALLHRALDAALKPSVFAGALEEPASQGLSLAIDILEFAGQREAAADTARDLITLYPDTRPAARARKFLDQHKLAVQPTPDPPEATAPPAPAEAGPPPTTPATEPPVRRRPRYPTPTHQAP